MEEFRKKYEKRFRFTSIMCCILPAAFFAARHFSQNTNEFAQGLVHGLFVAMIISPFVNKINCFYFNTGLLFSQSSC